LLPYLTTRSEIAQLAEGLPGCMFDELLRVETNDGSSEEWLAFLREFARDDKKLEKRPVAAQEPEKQVRRMRGNDAAKISTPEVVGQFQEVSGPLQKVTSGTWRSLGGYFDYTNWQERERFMELDRAIASARYRDEPGDEADTEIM
jgi:hypothetical protein